MLEATFGNYAYCPDTVIDLSSTARTACVGNNNCTLVNDYKVGSGVWLVACGLWLGWGCGDTYGHGWVQMAATKP